MKDIPELELYKGKSQIFMVPLNFLTKSTISDKIIKNTFTYEENSYLLEVIVKTRSVHLSIWSIFDLHKIKSMLQEKYTDISYSIKISKEIPWLIPNIKFAAKYEEINWDDLTIDFFNKYTMGE